MIAALCIPAVVLFSAIFLLFRAFYIGLYKRIETSSCNKKVSHVAFLHPSLTIGGAEKLIVNAAVSLQNRGIKVTLYTARFDISHCFEELRSRGPLAQCTRVFGKWIPSVSFSQAACVVAHMIYISICIFLFEYYDDIDAFIVDQASAPIPLLRYLGKPVLFYGHYPDKRLVQSTSKNVLRRLYRQALDYLEEVTTASADCVVVNSKYTQSTYMDTFPRLRNRELHVLYPPVQIQDFETEGTNCDVVRDPYLFVSLNRFERKKKLKLAIQAIAQLRNKIPTTSYKHIKLILAGGYDRNNIENVEHLEELKHEVAKYEVQDRVKFQTSPSFSVVKKLLKEAQAVIYTPSHEHFGIVPIEAMLCGTPVIAVNNGGPLETILHGITGYTCESCPEAFSDAMCKLYGPENGARVHEMGSKGKKHVQTTFSVEQFSETLHNLLTNLQ